MQRIILAAAIAMAVSPAFATEINLTIQVKDASGSAMLDCDHVNRDDPAKPVCDKFTAMTVGRAIAAALDRPDQALKMSEIRLRGEAAEKIRAAMDPMSPAKGHVELDPRDIDAITDNLPKMGVFTNSELGQIYTALAPPLPPGKDK